MHLNFVNHGFVAMSAEEIAVGALGVSCPLEMRESPFADHILAVAGSIAASLVRQLTIW